MFVNMHYAHYGTIVFDVFCQIENFWKYDMIDRNNRNKLINKSNISIRLNFNSYTFTIKSIGRNHPNPQDFHLVSFS